MAGSFPPPTFFFTCSGGGGGTVDKTTKRREERDPYCQEHETGWGEWIVVWEQDPAMVQSAFEICLLGSADGEVPLENVRLFSPGMIKRKVEKWGMLEPWTSRGNSAGTSFSPPPPPSFFSSHTSSGPAAKSVEGSITSSRASCMIRFTASVELSGWSIEPRVGGENKEK